jgi:FixJ family two-component response regulator
LSKIPVISIIDDDESVRTAVARLIQSLGFVALIFASAREFLRSPRRHETSCLITDVQMPDISGTDLQRILIAEGKNVPIILITAFPDEGIRTRALNAGAVGFLSKPFEGSALIQCIADALKTQSGQD